MTKWKIHFQRLLAAARHTGRGLLAAARTETAFQQELIVLGLAVPLAFFVASEVWKRVSLIIAVVVVLIVELLNTAIEKLSDHVTPDDDPVIGFVKDLGSSAVGLAIVAALVIWLVAFAERFSLILPL